MKHKRVFEFIENLDGAFKDLCGHPTLKFADGCVEVYFDTSNTIRNLDILKKDSDEIRIFSTEPGIITIVYTFWIYDEEED